MFIAIPYQNYQVILLVTSQHPGSVTILSDESTKNPTGTIFLGGPMPPKTNKEPPKFDVFFLSKDVLFSFQAVSVFHGCLFNFKGCRLDFPEKTL